MSKPGGTDWDGEARETAVESAYADRGVVWQATKHAQQMAGVAERGASDMSRMRVNALEAIEEAENDEFVVGLLDLIAIFPAIRAERPGWLASAARICHEYRIPRMRMTWV